MADPEHPWLAAALDVMMKPLFPARELVVPAATGAVLEVGVGTGLNFELHQAGAESMPFPDARFDTAVVTFTLCTIPDPIAALAELRRVLRPGGRMLFVEHTRSSQPVLAGVQDLLTPLWKRIGGGCHLNRPSLDLVREQGFSVADVAPVWREHWTLMPIYRATARRDT